MKDNKDKRIKDIFRRLEEAESQADLYLSGVDLQDELCGYADKEGRHKGLLEQTRDIIQALRDQLQEKEAELEAVQRLNDWFFYVMLEDAAKGKRTKRIQDTLGFVEARNQLEEWLRTQPPKED